MKNSQINFEELYSIISTKIASQDEKSYTNKLVKGDISRLVQKIRSVVNVRRPYITDTNRRKEPAAKAEKDERTDTIRSKDGKSRQRHQHKRHNMGKRARDMGTHNKHNWLLYPQAAMLVESEISLNRGNSCFIIRVQ